MDIMSAVLLLSGIVALVLALLNLRRSCGLVSVLRAIKPRRTVAAANLPSVSVLAPCRGVEAHFEDYVQGLLSQEYPRYTVLFLVESTADAAWPVLHRLLANTPGGRASLVITGTAAGCSQKIHNLLVGLEHITPETSLLAFVDSDAQVHPQWLRALVTPLDAATVGATSGYRWYVPCPGGVAGSLRSAWNAATLSLMAHPRYGLAWGGSSAMRREVFEKLGIRNAWSRGLSDDLLLTQGVRAAGLSIVFVAACLVPTIEPCTWRQLIEWTNRQTTIVRVYGLPAWVAGLLVHLISFILGVLGICAVAFGQWLAAGMLLSYWVINALGSLMVCRAALQRLLAHGFSIAQRAWVQALWTPGVTVLALVNLAMSLTTRTITWRGVSYTMLAPQQVIVHRTPHLHTPSSQAS
jgi:cellulose synthase/poly-beta-1,6-N-acetylglucosamine synthase-like glycosyltransferase